MKVLIISSYLPYPLFSGGQVRLYNLIKELSAKHEITLICEKRAHQTNSDITEVKKICKHVITVKRRRQWSISNILKAGLSPHSFLITGHTNQVFKQKIQETLNHNHFDVIHIETYYVTQNMPPTTLPIVLVDHNIEYQVYQKFMQRAPVFLRPFLKMDISKIKREEEYFWKQASALIAVSREDQEIMKKVGCNPFLVANGVDTDKFTVKNFSKSNDAKEKKILFLGDFKWIQNRDAAIFIIKEIWPKIKESGTIKLWIVGRKIPDSIKSLNSDASVFFDEESSHLSTEKIFQKADVLLAPIRIGGGTSYKILEAMSSGIPVVTMQMSADALGAKDGEDIQVGQTTTELAEKTLLLLEDDELYRKISKNGRVLVEKNYTWKEIVKKLEEVYTKAMLY
ncbi:MAG TPA: glycosyltransferase family 4 protein [Candidatus Sulfotelmatobacter sp.]|jgi:glycosyltransferase involved in cell wall biosynthesis|nr:glycosyltransferase family 4 protein [Candidatus Sulfotelmatobacter sp.]